MHKVWGSTTKIGEMAGLHVHQLAVKSGGYCSRHCHLGRHNWFYVETGELQIEVWTDGLENPPHVTMLRAREFMSVPPHMHHRFTALKDTHCLEVYWSEVDDNDIVRADTGGVREESHA